MKRTVCRRDNENDTNMMTNHSELVGSRAHLIRSKLQGRFARLEEELTRVKKALAFSISNSDRRVSVPPASHPYLLPYIAASIYSCFHV